MLIVIRPRNSGRAENGGTIVVVNSELAEAAVDDAARPSDGATVAVIIPTFNQARFLAEAIMSVLAQTRPANEIIVVDDGSTDGPANVVVPIPKGTADPTRQSWTVSGTQPGLRSCSASHIVFLDADDRLLPTALEAGLLALRSDPTARFVYGALRIISENGHPIESNLFIPVDGDRASRILTPKFYCHAGGRPLPTRLSVGSERVGRVNAAL